jgi:hypothetical protein
MWKNIVQPGRATDENTAHAHCMLDTNGYKHSQNMQYFCLSTATSFVRARFNVALCVHNVPCYFQQSEDPITQF